MEIPELSVCGLNADTYPGSSLKPCLSAVNPLSSCFILLYFTFSLLFPLDPLCGYLRESLDPTAPRRTSSSTGSVSACLRTAERFDPSSGPHHELQAVQTGSACPTKSHSVRSCHSTKFTPGEPTEQRAMSKITSIASLSGDSGNRMETAFVMGLTQTGWAFLTVS